MNNIQSKRLGKQLLADLTVWEQENSEDNAQQLQRLHRNLRLARQQVLTPRQQQVITLFFEQQMNMTEIARQLGIHRSTVSRTLQRAKSRLYQALRYSF
ncbi:sigma-70 family RNA polymerase sigma factor [uncultured Oscillibacter sp.]|uniref:sigma-70 family RNA polymerase sigma factor n=1 Tax=uncultured Oscillibacter sp. TaxID=876091 RepID=UPI0025E4887F|nr:sigma-70 family RNA polymerase sigma factor [uncultured Oscillibacter sp.]